jgi:hypothetical protein
MLQKNHRQTVARRIDRAANNRTVLVEKFNVALFATRFSASSSLSQGNISPVKGRFGKHEEASMLLCRFLRK